MSLRLFDPGPGRPSSWTGRANRARYGTLDVDIRATEQSVYDALNAEFHFELDVAALPENAKCARYFTPAEDGLAQPWAPARCWMNPPYSDLPNWTRKAVHEAQRGALVVGLLPARTDLVWFHENVLAADAELWFVRGRLRFARPLERPEWATFPGPSIVVIWTPDSASGGGA